MLTKYGWKEGQGLGKSQQGISTALEVQRIGKNKGVIIDKHAIKQKTLQTPTQPSPCVTIRVTRKLNQNMTDVSNNYSWIEKVKSECSRVAGNVEDIISREVILYKN
ncbi:Splicing factor 45 [Thelohanellus kitauei]|uniref:Splicing factor 45 n=1 Tax=Thelohanellus kitauei TaxID=669202 RepID=A0A0C2NLW4_THEKT|nr:Splicing factor 45 [Thelohanellus kitauei]